MSALEIAVEEVVGNRLGSGAYRRWVEQLPLTELASAGFRTRGLLGPARLPLMGEVLSGVWVA